MYRLTCLMLVSGLVAVACDNGLTVDPTQLEWHADLEGETGWEQLDGSAVVQSVEGTAQFGVTVGLAGDEPGAVRPWHVHFNTCAEGGGIVGEDGDYPRLTVLADGTATASVTVPEPLVPGASYHVNVHRSNDDLATIIACGDLVRVN